VVRPDEAAGLLPEKRRAVSGTRNLSVIFPNEDLHELDVFFLVDGATPVCIECKTGEFRQEIDKYLRLKKRLGIDRSQFILCCTGLSDEQAAGLSGMYELTSSARPGSCPIFPSCSDLRPAGVKSRPMNRARPRNPLPRLRLHRLRGRRRTSSNTWPPAATRWC
jgi:hypothetical protein